MMLVKRRGNADDNRVQLGYFGIVCGRGEAGGLGGGDFFGKNTVDVRTTGTYGSDLLPVNIEASDAEFLLTEQQSEGQANISKSDNAYAQLAGSGPVKEGFYTDGRRRCTHGKDGF